MITQQSELWVLPILAVLAGLLFAFVYGLRREQAKQQFGHELMAPYVLLATCYLVGIYFGVIPLLWLNTSIESKRSELGVTMVCTFGYIAVAMWITELGRMIARRIK